MNCVGLKNCAPQGVGRTEAYLEICAVMITRCVCMAKAIKDGAKGRKRKLNKTLSFYARTTSKRNVEKRLAGNGVSKHSHGSHVVFWQQRYLQHLGVGLHDFVAGSGDGFAGDPVDLVEGMRSQEAIVCGPDEKLQGERLAFHVAIKLARRTEKPR